MMYGDFSVLLFIKQLATVNVLKETWSPKCLPWHSYVINNVLKPFWIDLTQNYVTKMEVAATVRGL